MRTLISRICLVIAVLILCVYAILPVEKKLRLGKDLRGGSSLIYSVQLKPGDPADTVPRVIDVLKNRVDPQGLSEISIVRQGEDRIEITMPLANERTQGLKRAYNDALAKFDNAVIDPGSFEQAMRLTGPERDAEIKRLGEGLPRRTELLAIATKSADEARAIRVELTAAQAALKAAKDAPLPDTAAQAAKVAELDAKVLDLITRAGDAESRYDAARKEVLSSSVTAEQVRRIFTLPADVRRLPRSSAPGQFVDFPSQRDEAKEALLKANPDLKPKLDAAFTAYSEWAAQRTPLDDSADLERLLSGAGVLEFRIAVNPNQHPQEERLRRELRERGPRNVQSDDARWYQLHKIEQWYESIEELEFMRADPQSYFRTRWGHVAEFYQGEYYALCWDVKGSRLTRAEGADWAVERAYQSADQLGRPSIAFEMNPIGAGLLGEMTRQHVGNKMAVLLDDRVYTAPTLQSVISKNGQITGNFSTAEIQYISRVLGAGALQAKLSPEPISRSSLGPELGADNLTRGFETGVAAFIVVSIFMIIYYFPKLGLIAVFALWCNLLVILGVMALNHAAFTLPGIAGIILTFGQAVDSNVLIYERMREEFNRGADMKTAVRLGFSKAFSSIVDGNVANLIVCAVLYQVGTQEIKGFAITLAIGVLATLFGALVVSRLIFTILVDHLGWKRTSMLPMAIPGFQALLTPKIDWIRLRWVFTVVSLVLVTVGIFMAIARGPAMLDTEFRGGTRIELTFKKDASGKPLTLSRQDVEDRIRRVASAAQPGDDVRNLADAEILPINPEANGVTSDRFRIQTFEVDERTALNAVNAAFADVLQTRQRITFNGLDQEAWRQAPVYKVLSPILGEDVDRPDLRQDVGPYFGGVVILLDNITPPTSKAELEQRLKDTRLKPEFSDTISRRREVQIIEGTPDAVKAAVVLVKDDAVNSFDNEDRWAVEVAAREWKLTQLALGQASTLANVQTFSPTIAQSFTARAVVAIVLSLILLTIYVWVRFGAARWALAATLPLFHDILSILGLIAIAQILFERVPALSNALGILPFKIDLNMVAAMLTIAGFSLNDTIIILDRIRENKGKLEYASAQQVNDAINQTISRTLITSGTTLISTVILYLFGGEAVRGFAYAFTLGVFIGTYSSIAISAPLVWSRKSDRLAADKIASPRT